jgi:mannose-6-phosphate isomerase-like protein (cupin superfamily)
VYVISRDQLPDPDSFEGKDHGVDISFFYVDAGSGGGPALHQHDYAEVFIVLEGESMFVAGDEERLVRGGEVVVVPGGTPHRFYNVGDGILRQINIHVSPRFVTEWLNEGPD